MIYNKEKGWYFIHVPKNAGTAIVSQFISRARHTDEKKKCRLTNNRIKYGIKATPFSFPTYHNKADFWGKSEELQGLNPVAILRNPWSRALSLYLFNLNVTQKNLHEDWGAIDHPILTRQGFKTSWMEGGFFVDGHGKHIEYNKETGRAWAQDDDQYSWLEGQGKWFRMEDQLDDFYKFTGLPDPKKIINATEKGDYRRYYDDELIDRIGQLFHRDVKLGNYSF